MAQKSDKNIKNPSHYPGVFTAIKKDGTPYFRASITHKCKHISLGSFSTPDAAESAYREGYAILRDPGITLSHYAPGSPLSFEKWVSLLNFRDNGIYFGKPIYVGLKMFSYYLSPTLVLKFDPDDLFY